MPQTALWRYFFFALRWKRVLFSIFLCFFLRMRLRRFLISDPMRTKKLVHAAGGHGRTHLTVMRSVAGGDTGPFFSTASRIWAVAFMAVASGRNFVTENQSAGR